ncbi:YajG family lipoprotein [Desulforhopalus sp. IMCC35007]|uniref:YajG family lipoprotein n=1 Tax=Desulforhopalus sp. IMCC35007 TaxID=2569543 RepID=UPI0010AED83E|nr:YajG family lipoprotein [Desulforhopalus sp. IMCC35007]TKB09270.1 hypothetical protein FCL48_09945 [Desulforhopalus sp. IMCC35007]
MKKIVLIVCVLLFCGCSAKYPQTAHLDIMMPSQTAEVYSNSAVFVHGFDSRETPEVVLYNIKKDQTVRVPGAEAPLVVVVDRLTAGLKEQGLSFEREAPVRIDLEIKELKATVTKSKTMYTCEAVIQIILKASNGQSSIRKKYNRQDEQKSVSRPKIGKIENMLNTQLAEIITEMLSDRDLRDLINEK